MQIRSAMMMLALTLSCVVDALNPEIKALFKDFAYMDHDDENFNSAFSDALSQLTPEMVWNWNSTYAYKDDEDRLPEHDVVNMTLELYDKIRNNEGPEADQIWFMALLTDTYPELHHSRTTMLNMRYLAEMYQGKYRFAAVMQETWDGWNFVQMTDTFVLPNMWLIVPDGQGGHMMHELVPMMTSLYQTARFIENKDDGLTQQTYKSYPMPEQMGEWKMRYFNSFRYWLQVLPLYEDPIRDWLNANDYDDDKNFMDAMPLIKNWWSIHQHTRCHFLMWFGVPLAILILGFPIWSVCCFCFCCCTQSAKKAKKPAVSPKASAKATPKKAPAKKGEKLE